MERPSRVSRGVFGAAVALALAFGAGQALAGAPAAEAAAYTTAGCQASCEKQYPGREVLGVCSTATGRCVCLVG